MIKYLIFCIVIVFVNAVHDSLNFVLHSGHKECFYEHFNEDKETRTIDAFVQAGSGAYLQIFGPLKLEEIQTETFKNPAILTQRIDATKESISETQSYTQDFKPDLEGVYAICLDNSRNSFLDNIVQLDVRRGPKEIHYGITSKSKEDKGAASSDLQSASGGDKEIIKALESISRIRKGLVAIQIQQLRDRRRLILYNETNKTNRNEMLIASLAETAVFVLAAIFQIYFVRRWFVKRETVLSSSSNNMIGSHKLSA
eukprot:TRINITY_DN70605_c0_g1_i1.p1 TRINITY_DN70605_c0_g1~~TRINITY_DN70605_c0_g1_i1.p1  ORF type:complete len:256 (+),score=-15.30 TRINITY_DN70605_c0_g1_i1:21-788(+)